MPFSIFVSKYNLSIASSTVVFSGKLRKLFIIFFCLKQTFTHHLFFRFVIINQVAYGDGVCSADLHGRQWSANARQVGINPRATRDCFEIPKRLIRLGFKRQKPNDFFL